MPGNTKSQPGKYAFSFLFVFLRKNYQIILIRIVKVVCFVVKILQYKIVGAGTTLENQTQQSVSTLTVSRNQKKPRRNLSRQMSWKSFERKLAISRCMVEKNWGKKMGESKRSKLDTKFILSHSFRIWAKVIFFFLSLESSLVCCENSLWVPLKLQISAMPGGRLIKCWRSSHLAQI